jgi:hypothetical protein
MTAAPAARFRPSRRMTTVVLAGVMLALLVFLIFSAVLTGPLTLPPASAASS